MISKVIHYCWFGGAEKPEPAKKCIESWRRFCPDYEILEWNESNIDISACPLFVREAYARRKWAFVTDYIRLKVVFENGGIYLDTDVELLKPLDGLLDNCMFAGCEGTQYVNTGVGFGAQKNFSFLRENMEVYEKMNPINVDGEFVSSPCPHYTTQLLKKKGVEFPITQIVSTVDGIKLFPNEYFNPYDWKFDKLRVTPKTYSIHHYSGSWMSSAQKKGLIQSAKVSTIEKRFGKAVAKIYDFYFWSKKENGGPGAVRAVGRALRGIGK